MLRLVRAFRAARPQTSACILLLFLASGVGLVYGYARWEWHAARQAVAQSRAKDALKRLKFCLGFWPNSPEVHLLAARACWLSNNFDGAEAHLKQCTTIQDGASEATQLEYLLMRAASGEEDEVGSILFAHVENHHPQAGFILETMSRAYMHRFRYGPALDALTRWIKEAPDSAKPYHWRGWVLERLEHYHEAMDDYKEALKRDPELSAARLRVAELLLDENKLDDAVPHLEMLYEKLPERGDVLARLGHARFLQGDLKEARRLMEEAEKILREAKLPDDAPLLLHLAQVEIQEDRPAEAEKWLRRAVKADPADVVVRYTLSTALQVQGRRAEAAVALKEYNQKKELGQKVVELLRDEAHQASKGPEIPTQIGVLLQEMGHPDTGAYWLTVALMRDRNYRPAQKALADYTEKTARREKAILPP
jgi:tetratricopeptide (TPR) repeat protein